MERKYSVGFIGHSLSNGEKRVPIWWEHLTPEVLKHPLLEEYIFEESFGSSAFREVTDESLKRLGCKVLSRMDLLSLSDIVVSLKPVDEWLYMKPGSILAGWFSHIQIPQDNALGIRFLNFEDIKILADGRSQKLLYKNAYVAGECGVAQTLDILKEIAPDSPAVSSENRVSVVFGYGNLGEGAVDELKRQDVERIIVFTQRNPSQIRNKFPGVEYRQIDFHSASLLLDEPESTRTSSISAVLSEADIIVNATLPSAVRSNVQLISWGDFTSLKPGMAYIDPVHRAGHGACFARTTSLTQAVEQIHYGGRSIWYNGCDAMPSYRPAHASFVISQAITTYLDTILATVDRMNTGGNGAVSMVGCN